MKLIIGALALLASSSAFAAAKEYGEVTIDWSNKYLEETVVLQCDDTYLSGIDLLIPGELTYGGEFVLGNYITYDGCDVNWRLLNKQIVTVDGKKMTKVRLESGGACAIKVREQVEYPKKAREFTVDVSDGC